MSLVESSSFGSKSVHAPAPSTIPHSPCAQRSCSASRSGAERRDRAHAGDDDFSHSARSVRPGDDQIDCIADCLELPHVLALEYDAVLVLDDLRELDEIERVDVELLERGGRG